MVRIKVSEFGVPTRHLQVLITEGYTKQETARKHTYQATGDAINSPRGKRKQQQRGQQRMLKQR